MYVIHYAILLLLLILQIMEFRNPLYAPHLHQHVRTPELYSTIPIPRQVFCYEIHLLIIHSDGAPMCPGRHMWIEFAVVLTKVDHSKFRFPQNIALWPGFSLNHVQMSWLPSQNIDHQYGLHTLFCNLLTHNDCSKSYTRR